MMLYDGNVCTSQPDTSLEQRRLCSGSAQGRLSFGSGLLKLATLIHTLARNAHWKRSTFNEEPKQALLPLARNSKYLPYLI